MDMNPRSLSRSHSRSTTLHNNTLYSSTSHIDTRYSQAVRRPRIQNMSRSDHQHVSHGNQQHSHHQHPHPHPHRDMSRNTPPAVAPPVLQKVYILDCKSCDTFLTNRGMMAVLLLQPEVPLYSTDALPVNCSAMPGPLEYAPCYTYITESSSSLCPSGVPVPVPRTCECLTQTLSCHGCGNAVGYMVVIPCNRCTSSVSPTNRHTNRHRFVFFNKEITASERHYIPHEPGVVTTSPLLVTVITPSSSISPSSSLHSFDSTPPPSSPATHHDTSYMQYTDYAGRSVPPLPTPPPDSPMSIDYASQTSYAITPSDRQRQRPGFPSFQFMTLKPERGKLRAGDVIYWHNLARSGEIPAVVEDERARHAPESRWSPWAGR